MSNAATSMGVQISLPVPASVLLGIYPDTSGYIPKLLGHTVILGFIFLRTCPLFFTAAVPFSTPTGSDEDFNVVMSLPMLVIF